MDYSLPGFSVHGILQARILERVAIPFSRDLPDPGIEPRSAALHAILYCLSCIFTRKYAMDVGEGNGNPLQYSYLENPVVRGAW